LGADVGSREDVQPPEAAEEHVLGPRRATHARLRALAGGCPGTPVLSTGLRTANELGFTPIDLPPLALPSPLIASRAWGEQRDDRSATTVVAHVACGAIVGGFASIADRPQTAGRPSDPTCSRTLMLSVGSGRSAGWAAG
jgi:hypothetical protein